MVPTSKEATLKPSSEATITSSTAKTTTTSDVESDLGTLIINDESDDEDNNKTLKPAFLQHFERSEAQPALVSFSITLILKLMEFAF